jgi:fructose-1,6-bisphosphatase/inositol monophosphatase family enzyme
MNWEALTENKKNILHLPALQNRKIIDLNDICLSQSKFNMPVNDNFLEVWHAGPVNNSIEELERCVNILGETFNQLIKTGKAKTHVSEKNGPSDLVTEIDAGVEMLLRIWIQKYYPEHKIIGEEGYKDQINSSDWTWYIDPIDGTTNYVKGNENVSLLIGCIQKGKPALGCVGLPFQNKLLISTKNYKQTIKSKSELILGTEYKSGNIDEETDYLEIMKRINAKKQKVNSIGVNLLSMLENDQMAFYKKSVKLWDVIAPLVLLYFARRDYLDIKIYIPEEGNILNKNNFISFSPFTNNKKYLSWINKQHKEKCQIGLLTVIPKNRKDIEETILKVVLK